MDPFPCHENQGRQGPRSLEKMRKKLGLMATTAGTFGCAGWENQCYEMGGGMVVVEEEVWGKFGDRWGHQWAASLLLGAASSKDLSRFCVFIYFDNCVPTIQSNPRK